MYKSFTLKLLRALAGGSGGGAEHAVSVSVHQGEVTQKSLTCICQLFQPAHRVGALVPPEQC